MTQQVHNTVFISYRRSVSAYLAHAIYLDLNHHGYDVFMDVEDIDSGKFDEIILRQIEARAHFLILCSPGTFERINESGDWLRREIEHAMKFKRNIVPIMASDFKFDDGVKGLLTGKIASLHRYNGVDVPYNYFPEAMNRLRTRFLKPVAVTIASTPVADAKTVADKQADIEAKSAPTQMQLSAEEYVLRGIALKEQGDNQGAIAEYNRALQINPNYAEAYARRGGRYYSQGKVNEAIADFEKALSLDPKNATAYNNRGITRQAKGDLDGAIVDYNEAISLNPQNINAYYNRGNARQANGDLDGAIADYTEAIRLNPSFAEVYGNRANARKAKGDLDGAIADYTEAIRLNPQGAIAYNNRGNARKAKGDLDGAIADYNEALRLNPQHTSAYFRRGVVREQKGDNNHALDDFLRYVELRRANPDPYWMPEAEKHIRELKQKLGIE